MATTTNYGWETPDDTDLVKDGALAQRTTASAIDSSMFAALGGKPAMAVLLNTTTVTSQATFSISSVFNATYDNYIIEIDGTNTTSTDLQYRFRQSTTDITATNYQRQQLNSSGTTTTSYRGTNGNAGVLGRTSTNLSAYSVKIYKPYLNTTTPVVSINVADLAASTNQMSIESGGYSTAAVIDGISFIPITGVFTGTVRVYGLRNS